MLIFNVTLDTDQYIPIILSNTNAEIEQLNILKELQSLLRIFDISQSKQIMWIVLAGDFNIFF